MFTKHYIYTIIYQYLRGATMENYNKLLNEIKQFLTMEEVVSDSDIISMYDLYTNVNHELNGLKELLTMNT